MVRLPKAHPIHWAAYRALPAAQMLKQLEYVNFLLSYYPLAG